MTALEQEIITQISKLDVSRQRQVLDYARTLENAGEQAPITLAEWLVLAQHSRAETRAKYGEHRYFNSQAMLDELREEASE